MADAGKASLPVPISLTSSRYPSAISPSKSSLLKWHDRESYKREIIAVSLVLVPQNTQEGLPAFLIQLLSILRTLLTVNDEIGCTLQPGGMIVSCIPR